MTVDFVYHPDYFCDIGEHVFPMEKFRLIRERLIADSGIQPEAFLVPQPADRSMLASVHTDEYLDDFQAMRSTPAIRSSELPINESIVRAYTLAAGGTVLAAQSALQSGDCAINLTGGFHHAFADHAEGFCYVHDVAVAVRLMQQRGKIKRALIIDVDLHQGNGTAVIFQDDPEVFTFSIHQERLYPAKQKSDLDLGLDDGTGDDEYLALLEKHVPRMVQEHQPDLIMYVAGADPFRNDVLGRLELTQDGLSRRDEIVFNQARENAIPVVSVLAGGYAAYVRDTVAIQYRMCCNALEIWGNALDE